MKDNNKVIVLGKATPVAMVSRQLIIDTDGLCPTIMTGGGVELYLRFL